jgi:catechol 2,3-dioxygenase-like lactoylglutathione lyase family enzyme
MLDHLSIGVRDLQRSIAFYDAAFAPLDYLRVWDGKNAAGYGEPGGEDKFAIKEETPSRASTKGTLK